VDTVTIRALPADGGGLLATHQRATRTGAWVVDEAHWDGLPDGHTRATTTVIAALEAARDRRRHQPEALTIEVGVRPLADYMAAAGLEGQR
jgi:hypothetical protein